MKVMSTMEMQIAQRAIKHKAEGLHNLSQFIDGELLDSCYRQLNKNSSSGVDEENWYEYGTVAKERIPNY